MGDLVLTALASIAISSLTFFLVWINWRILKLTEKLLEISVELLSETVIIRIETVRVREISESILMEATRTRKALGDGEEAFPNRNRHDRTMATARK